MSELKIKGVLMSEVEAMMEEKTLANAQFVAQFDATKLHIDQFPDDLPQEEIVRRFRLMFYLFYMQGIIIGGNVLYEQSAKN